MVVSSRKAGEHSIGLAEALGASPFIIGLLLVSIGTDLPEIVNSITSSALGHGDNPASLDFTTSMLSG
ncbi:MAG: hypothetical protein JSV58_06005 [Candidatus Bathyarchaeota archaeon]|nr:MAG: hypothetical protein JSV58_06005 [Candidatus Bathyarchaeota archaeon]